MESVTLEALTERLRPLARAGSRSLVALAGPPGAGKSHVSEQLLARLNEDPEAEDGKPGRVAILPMDGFHYDDMLLGPRGDLPRKGAPHTYDVAGFGWCLKRIAAGDAPVAVPVFDRGLEIARAGARIIGREVSLILVEGNYLLLDQPEWRALAPQFDLTVMIDAPEPVLRARLLARWAHLPPAEAEAKVAGNDLINMRTVREGSRPADLRLVNG